MAEAISDARRNAELNGINNATFVQGDLNKINDSFGNNFPKPDIVISGTILLKLSFMLIICLFLLCIEPHKLDMQVRHSCKTMISL